MPDFCATEAGVFHVKHSAGFRLVTSQRTLPQACEAGTNSEWR